MSGPERRHGSLTPLSSELGFDVAPAQPAPPGILKRLRRRRARRRERVRTVSGMIGLGLLRLAISTGVASGLAVLIDRLTGRSAAFGFYILGAFVLAAGVLMSAGDVGSPYYYRQYDRERRVSLSFSYVLAGAIVIAIAVAIEATSS